jgi:hypothetical protein
MTLERAILQNTASDSVQDTPLESLKAARTLQKLRRSHGVNRVDLIVEDVEGDWLEQWGEEEATDAKATPEKIQ